MPAREKAAAPSILVQVLRGIGWTAALLATAGLVAWVQPLSLHWKRLALVAAIVVAVWGVRRQLRRWPGRPRWFVPVGGVVLAACLFPAVWTFKANAEPFAPTCVPLVDAWHRAMPPPSPSDFAVVNSIYSLATGVNLRDPAQRVAVRQAQARILTSPASQRVWHWQLWRSGSGPCAPRARKQLAASVALLVVGAAGLTVVVRRSGPRRFDARGPAASARGPRAPFPRS